MLCCVVLSILSAFVIILLRKRELVALIMFKLSCYYQYSLLVPRGAICVSVWSVIRAISDNTHLLLE